MRRLASYRSDELGYLPFAIEDDQSPARKPAFHLVASLRANDLSGSCDVLHDKRSLSCQFSTDDEASPAPIMHSQAYVNEAIEILRQLDVPAVDQLADDLAALRANGGRLFFLGVGGSAGNCSHAVNDFRKIVGIESYAPTDNVSELTARTNDEGWATIFVEWLKTSKLLAKDALFIFSVGGGNLEKNISPNLVEALKYAKTIGAKITGVVGRDGGYT